MQAPLSAVAIRSPITNDLSETAQVIVCGGETITEVPDLGALSQSIQRPDPVNPNGDQPALNCGAPPVERSGRRRQTEWMSIR